MREEAVIVGGVERKGRTRLGMRSTRESSVYRAGVFILRVKEGVEIVRRGQQ